MRSDHGRVYDAFGLRVYRKEDHGKEVFYFRDADGNVLSQYSRPVNVASLTPQWDRDFVYFDGKRVNMVETPLPNAPAWLSSQATSSQITLQWYPSQITYGYLILKQSSPGSQFVPLFNGSSAITTTATSYTDTQVTAGTTYTYKVLAVDYAGNQGPESAERLITAGDSTSPPAPTNLSEAPGNARVTLTWVGPSSVADLAGYYVYRRLGSGTYGAPLNSIAITVTNYTDLAVTNGTTYYYVVKAVDTAGLISVASNEVSAKPKAMQQGYNYTIPGLAPAESGEAVAERGEPGSELTAAPYAVVGQIAGANILFLHSDHLGSLRLVTNTQGIAVSIHKYLPFGEEVQPMHTLNPYRFAGYERDSESGKDYVKARYYNPSPGRWLTADPLGDGFRYVANSPTMDNDPTGLCSLVTRCVFRCTIGPGGEYCRMVCASGIVGCDGSAIGVRSSGGAGGGGNPPPAVPPGPPPPPPEPDMKKELNCGMARFAIAMTWTHALAGSTMLIGEGGVLMGAGGLLMMAPTGVTQFGGALTFLGGLVTVGGGLIMGTIGLDVLIDSQNINNGTTGPSPLPEFNLPQKVLSSAGCL